MFAGVVASDLHFEFTKSCGGRVSHFEGVQSFEAKMVKIYTNKLDIPGYYLCGYWILVIICYQLSNIS